MRDARRWPPGKRYEDWVVDDPGGRPLEAVRGIRDAIAARVARLEEDLPRD